jgi:hypothetical protein
LSEKSDAMSPLTGRVQEIEKRVDDLPGDITTEGLHQQTADTTTVGPIHTECARERENHDEPNKNAEILFAGSRTLLGFLIKFEDIPKVVC